jgi:protein-S-isoprenylcysteine O-methyltransferase Ste14
MLLEHLFLFIIWLVFYALHSLLASDWMKMRMGIKAQSYRLLYGLFSSISFAGLLFYTASIYSTFIFKPSPISQYLGLIMAAIGIFVIKRAFRNYSFKAFMGLKAEQHEALITSGLQAHVRHPLYTGTIALFIGYFIFNPLASNLVMLISLCVYLPFGIRSEERKLISAYGQVYLDYQKDTPSIIPSFKRKRK